MKTLILIFAALLPLGCDNSTPPANFEGSAAPEKVEPGKPIETELPAEHPAPDDTITGRVIKIVDGDTLDILDSEKITVRVRLEGIDTPERGQPFSAKAKDKLGELTFGKMVSVRSIGEDRYGRTRGRITADGIDVNLKLVRSGFAWHYKQYSDEKALADAENEARAAKVGLWSPDAETPIAPWDW